MFRVCFRFLPPALLLCAVSDVLDTYDADNISTPCLYYAFSCGHGLVCCIYLDSGWRFVRIRHSVCSLSISSSVFSPCIAARHLHARNFPRHYATHLSSDLLDTLLRCSPTCADTITRCRRATLLRLSDGSTAHVVLIRNRDAAPLTAPTALRGFHHHTQLSRAPRRALPVHAQPTQRPVQRSA